ncbi:MAG TPA: AAA family ATPase [Capsulimonadaceae bacterium]|jgi:predicted ATPase
MANTQLFDSLFLRDFLSYAPGTEIKLGQLNVLVGPNASGKSNLLSAIRVLRDLRTGLYASLISGGGVAEFVRKVDGANEFVLGFSSRSIRDDWTVTYGIRVFNVQNTAVIAGETTAMKKLDWPQEQEKAIYESGYREHKVAVVSDPFSGKFNQPGDEDDLRAFAAEPANASESVLSYRTDYSLYPTLARISQQLSRIAIYSDAYSGASAPFRGYQPLGLPDSALAEDYSNLAHVLHDIDNRPGGLNTINEHLSEFYEGAIRVTVRVLGGALLLNIEEEGLTQTIPAYRLSDGTLRYLCLLAILLHPSPPPLICIEEPEVGLHPDMISSLASLLHDAATRTQVIVTTHSDLLVSAFSDTPEVVLVCDRTVEGTQVKRLDSDELKTWLKDYSLGEVWLKGAIGGTRW